jgi:hypothetical protein
VPPQIRRTRKGSASAQAPGHLRRGQCAANPSNPQRLRLGPSARPSPARPVPPQIPRTRKGSASARAPGHLRRGPCLRKSLEPVRVRRSEAGGRMKSRAARDAMIPPVNVFSRSIPEGCQSLSIFVPPNSPAPATGALFIEMRNPGVSLRSPPRLPIFEPAKVPPPAQAPGHLRRGQCLRKSVEPRKGSASGPSARPSPARPVPPQIRRTRKGSKIGSRGSNEGPRRAGRNDTPGPRIFTKHPGGMPEPLQLCAAELSGTRYRGAFH